MQKMLIRWRSYRTASSFLHTVKSRVLHDAADFSEACNLILGINFVHVYFKPASNFVLLIVPSRYFCGGSFCFMSWCLKYFVLLVPYVCLHIFS